MIPLSVFMSHWTEADLPLDYLRRTKHELKGQKGQKHDLAWSYFAVFSIHISFGKDWIVLWSS